MSSISFSGLLQVVTDGMMKMMAILLIYSVSYKSLHYMHSLEKGEVHYIIFFLKKKQYNGISSTLVPIILKYFKT